MKPNYSALFNNKIIKPGEYLARVDFVCEVDAEGPEKGLYVEVVIDNNESEADGTRLVAILQATPKAMKFIEAFLESYRVNRGMLEQALGRWAVVYVYNAIYKGSTFSNVKFHSQSSCQREKVAELEISPPRGNVKTAMRITGGGTVPSIETGLDVLSDKLDLLGA